jgi:hypothetical protein
MHLPEAEDREPVKQGGEAEGEVVDSGWGANTPSWMPRATIAARSSRQRASSSSRNWLTCRLCGARAHASIQRIQLAAHPSTLHPLPPEPRGVLGQQQERHSSTPALVPDLLPEAGPSPLRRNIIRWLVPEQDA